MDELVHAHQRHAGQDEGRCDDARRQHRLALQEHAKERRKQHARFAAAMSAIGATVMAQMAMP